MNQLDSFFAQATELPATLDQTDLISLDSEVLAKTGVISYAPTYPLWSDNAGKMRYLRVPVGKSIVFDKSKQTFTIPANTRFYKTFLKEVIDANGNPAFRKIETRLIVSRPDTTKLGRKRAAKRAVWDVHLERRRVAGDAVESTAAQQFAVRRSDLHVHHRRSQGSGDHRQQPARTSPRRRTRRRSPATTPSLAPRAASSATWGAPAHSFVLGFTPLQVARRPDGEGGVYEAASGDELTQVQRLIDYGVITGLTSQADILPLERSRRVPSTAQRPRTERAGLHGRQLRPLPQPAWLSFHPTALGCRRPEVPSRARLRTRESFSSRWKR